MYTVQYQNTPDLVIFVAETVRYRSQGSRTVLGNRVAHPAPEQTGRSNVTQAKTMILKILYQPVLRIRIRDPVRF